MIKAEDQTLKATDLRIGNYMTSKTWKGYHRIDGIQLIEDGFRVFVKGFWHEFKKGIFVEIEPIELNEEWLIKLGFEGKVETGVCVAYKLGTNPVTGDWLIELIKIHDTPYFFYKNGHFLIKTVHQLQNLYHALTGQDLTFSSPV